MSPVDKNKEVSSTEKPQRRRIKLWDWKTCLRAWCKRTNLSHQTRRSSFTTEGWIWFLMGWSKKSMWCFTSDRFKNPHIFTERSAIPIPFRI